MKRSYKMLYGLILAECSDITSSHRRTKWWRTSSASTTQMGCGPVAASATFMAAMSVNTVVSEDIHYYRSFLVRRLTCSPRTSMAGSGQDQVCHSSVD